jgi:hypothetical protein
LVLDHPIKHSDLVSASEQPMKLIDAQQAVAPIWRPVFSAMAFSRAVEGPA